MRLRFILPSVLILMAAAFLGESSAAVVAQLDGPTTYGPGAQRIDLGEVTMGDAGYIEMEFQTDVASGVLWYMADAWGGTTAGGEYRLFLNDDALHAALWNTGGYAVLETIPMTASTDWHSVSMAWQEGSDTLVTLDGVTSSFTNNHALADFTSGLGENVSGDYPADGTVSLPFGGSVRNIKLCDTYTESASIVAQNDGPVSFVDHPMQSLGEVTIGDEGSIDLEFQINGEEGCIWYMADSFGGTATGGEYRLLVDNDSLYGILWNSGGYAAQIQIPINEATDWHSVSFTWKEGEGTSLTLDGVTSTMANTHALGDFTSGVDQNVLGGYPSGGDGSFLFDGMTRNVVISDTYTPASAPIPGDANSDGKVDGSDVTILAGNWQTGVDGMVEATWEMGDFNGDKKVDGSDVTILAGNWQTGVTTAATAVPEPSVAFGLLCLGLASLTAIIRRRA